MSQLSEQHQKNKQKKRENDKCNKKKKKKILNKVDLQLNANETLIFLPSIYSPNATQVWLWFKADAVLLAILTNKHLWL